MPSTVGLNYLSGNWKSSEWKCWSLVLPFCWLKTWVLLSIVSPILMRNRFLRELLGFRWHQSRKRQEGENTGYGGGEKKSLFFFCCQKQKKKKYTEINFYLNSLCVKKQSLFHTFYKIPNTVSATENRREVPFVKEPVVTVVLWVAAHGGAGAPAAGQDKPNWHFPSCSYAHLMERTFLIWGKSWQLALLLPWAQSDHSRGS